MLELVDLGYMIGIPPIGVIVVPFRPQLVELVLENSILRGFL